MKRRGPNTTPHTFFRGRPTGVLLENLVVLPHIREGSARTGRNCKSDLSAILAAIWQRIDRISHPVLGSTPSEQADSQRCLYIRMNNGDFAVCLSDPSRLFRESARVGQGKRHRTVRTCSWRPDPRRPLTPHATMKSVAYLLECALAVLWRSVGFCDLDKTRQMHYREKMGQKTSSCDRASYRPTCRCCHIFLNLQRFFAWFFTGLFKLQRL